MYRDILIEELKIQKSNGYAYFLDDKHPLRVGNSGKVYLHRHVASIKLGRWLTTNEHVHHVNGLKTDNSEENLEVLSNSAHHTRHFNNLKEYKCPTCGELFKTKESNEAKYCSTKCAAKSRIKNIDLTKEILEELIPTMSWVALGKLFGYSDNGIKKRAVSLGCDIVSLKNKCRCGPKD